jgi:hypothetical protein
MPQGYAMPQGFAVDPNVASGVYGQQPSPMMMQQPTSGNCTSCSK